MAQNEEMQDLQEEPWEERTLNLLHDSKIDQDLTKAKARKRACKKHRVRWMKRPMAIPEVILEFQDKEFREAALRCLSAFLLEKREEDPENYYRTGYLLYNSCSTMAILLQEVVTFFRMMDDGSLSVRASKRLANVLTLFQCIAANREIRQKFVKLLFDAPLEVFENVRAVALSVVGILCQARESQIIQWAVESDMVEVCRISIEIGNELSKVIGMHILEAILRDDTGISYICSPMCDHLLMGLVKTWEHLVTFLAVDQDFSPRLLFHIIRCYVLLCNHARYITAITGTKIQYDANAGIRYHCQKQGFSIVAENLPDPIINGSFCEITEEFPVIGSLLQQLLLTVGKDDNCCFPPSLPDDLLLY